MIKLLFLIHDLGHGGAEKVLVNLVNNLDRSKFDITVIALFGGGVNEKFLKKDVHYRTIFSCAIPGNSRLMKMLTAEQLHRIFIKDKYDIEISYLEGPSARIISGCSDPSTKLICWIHVEQHTRQTAAKAFRSYAESERCYQKFDKIVCVSQSVKEDFLQLYPSLTKADVLYNTNETDTILQQKDEPIAEGVFQSGEYRLCGVGKIMPVKGFDKLARIHKRLIEDGIKVHTYVLGTGPEKENIELFLKENDLEDSFSFLGYQTNPYKYVSRCDVFVCASVAEGFSTAATEALIVGTPVVTTPVAGMHEMLGGDNEYGIVCEMSEDSLYQNIRRLLTDPALLQYYKAQAGVRGKCFSKENTVKAVERYLENLLAKDFLFMKN